MKQILLSCALMLVALQGIAQAQNRRSPHVFATQGDHFTLDGKPFKVLSGELHYARIPREYFRRACQYDTFLDTRNLGKGAVWINGHNLGRFWNTGPQQTLYVPGPWLKTGENEIVVFDMLPTAHESVVGLDHPILDGPVSDKTTSSQE